MPKATSYQLSGAQYWAQNGGESWSISAPGTGTLRFEVRSGDQWQYDPAWKERSEISGDAIYAAGETISVSYSFMVEPGIANTADWSVLGQFHADDGYTSPPFAIEMVGEKMAVVLRYKLPGAASETMVYAWTDTQNIERGHYYDIDIAVNFDVSGKGFLNVWRDGKQIVDYDGPIGYGYGVYWKHGVYREESKETIAVNYKNFALSSGGDAATAATDDSDGAVIVGTPVGDDISSASSPEGQPMVTNKGDTIASGGGSDSVFAGKGNDKIIGGKGKDILKGGAGDDLIKGGAGNDKLYGVAGNNKLVGGNGNDWLVGDGSNDILKGGKGKDAFVFAAGYGDDVINDFHVGQDRIAFEDSLFVGRSAVLSAATEMSGGVMVSAAEDSLFLAGLTMSQLKAADFLFA